MRRHRPSRWTTARRAGAWRATHLRAWRELGRSPPGRRERANAGRLRERQRARRRWGVGAQPPRRRGVSEATDVLLERVRKLLTKAEKTDNPHEAEAFAAKAAELIALHRIAPERLRPTPAGRPELRRVPLGRGAYVRARLALLGAVAQAHDAQVVFQSGPDGMTAILAGYPDDLDIVAVLYPSLHAQAASADGQDPSPHARRHPALAPGVPVRVRRPRGRAAGRARRDVERAAAAGGTTLPDLPARADEVGRFVAALVRSGRRRPPLGPGGRGGMAGRPPSSRRRRHRPDAAAVPAGDRARPTVSCAPTSAGPRSARPSRPPSAAPTSRPSGGRRPRAPGRGGHHRPVVAGGRAVLR